MKRQTVGRELVVVLSCALILAACGGSDPAADETTSADGTTAAPETTLAGGGTSRATSTTASPSQPSDGNGGSGEENVTIVAIGDQVFEFEADPAGPITTCNPDFFGTFWVVGGTEHGSSLSLLLPLKEGSNVEDPPSVRMADRSTESDWTADKTLIETPNYTDVLSESDSQIDSYIVDGNTASDTATFVDENQIFAVLGGTAAAVEPVTGTFEVTCGG